MIAIIDYGVGNVFSLSSSLRAVGADIIITGDAEEIRKADKLILPGVGAFGDAARKLFDSGLAEVILEETAKGKPLMGICLGMQMLFEKSYEYGEYDGLGLIKGQIVSMENRIPAELNVPHIGWNALTFTKESSLFQYVDDGSFVYFVHTYYGVDCEDSVIATAEYGIPLTAAVQKNNIFGCQFHPEKSGDVGLAILKAFCELET